MNILEMAVRFSEAAAPLATIFNAAAAATIMVVIVYTTNTATKAVRTDVCPPYVGAYRLAVYMIGATVTWGAYQALHANGSVWWQQACAGIAFFAFSYWCLRVAGAMKVMATPVAID